MKKFLYLIAILPLSLVWSCNHHLICCTPPPPSATVTAQKNGVNWAPLFAGGTLSNADSLSISATNAVYQSTTYHKIDTLNIKIAYTSPGTYSLKGNQAFYGVFNNNAVTGYKMDDTYNNVIVITGYERISNNNSTAPDQVKITGTFSIMFVDPNNPSGINFQNGNFYVLVPYL